MVVISLMCFLPEADPVLAVGPRSDSATELLALVGEGFRIKETEHFDIAYDTPYEIIRPLVGRLEGTYDAILRFCKFNKLGKKEQLAGLRVILYDQFEDYAQFAASVGIQSEFVAGFYSHPTNMAIFCNSLHSPALKQLHDEMDRTYKLLAKLREDRSGSTARARRPLVSRLDSLRSQRDEFVKRFNRFVIQHEAAHQVLFNLEVHVPGADNPNWLIEGLACQFEVPQTNPRGRLTRINHMRLADFRDALGVDLHLNRLADDALQTAQTRKGWMRLPEILTAPGPRNSVENSMAYYYGQAWSLVYFLHTKHRDSFAAYVRQLGQRKPQEVVDDEQRIEEFQRGFGQDLEEMERDWIGHTLGLRLDRAKAGR